MDEKLDLDSLEKLAQFVAKHGWVTEKWAEEHFGSETEAKFVAMLDGDTVLALIARIRASEATGNHVVSVPEGWELVPAKPTALMLYELMSDGWKDAARGLTPAHVALYIGRAGISYRYDAMLAAAPSATVNVAASGEAVQADLNANDVHEPKEGMHLDAEDVQFLATRLRRLFARFNYPLPKFADDGRRLIGIAPSCIGAVLANLDAAEVSSVPEGYALVPKEPTAEMQHAAALAVRFKTTPLNRIWIGNAAYRAAVAAAPTPTVSDDGARAKKTYTVRNGDGSTALVDDWWVYFDADGTARVGGAVVTVLSVKDNNAS